MGVYVCSLIVNDPQTVPGDGEYHLVRFPFGSAESYDAHGMHPAIQPDGPVVADYADDDRSGLIWPSHDGWAQVYGLMYWDTGSYTEVRSRFVRDPLDLSTGYDSTCTEDHEPTPGGQYRAKNWGIFVHPGTPVGLMVRPSGGVDATLMHAQFKMAIHT